MEDQDAHFRHNLLYYFRKGKNASQADKRLCAAYGNEALKERQLQNWGRIINMELWHCLKDGRRSSTNTGIT
ncbi:Histone-lysine N-methyltransferase SETMAR [Vespula squamosa]|uniref:Histone-lysine N-methyltransferase SETMAR n=1 Tax=Vespula squamosa TaxID=30214 RepID=A0ABD2BWY8_VESSQ